MRLIGALWLVALIFASSVEAQTYAGEIGPYRLGMTADAVSALHERAPDELRQLARSPDESVGLTRFEGITFIVRANHTQGAVHTLSFLNVQPDVPAQMCRVRHVVVARALAREFGPLDRPPTTQEFPIAPGDSADPNTPTADFEPEVTTLTDGTLIAAYSIPQTQSLHLVSELEGPRSVDLSSSSESEQSDVMACSTSFTVWDQSLRDGAYAVADGASPPALTQNEAAREALAARLRGAERLHNPVFLETPPDPVWRFYPGRAIDHRQVGDVTADCLILSDGRLECLITSEEPLGWGFGAAALQIFSAYRVDVAGGATGKYIRLRMPFRYS